MAYLFADGFDWPGSTTDMTMRWDSATIASSAPAAANFDGRLMSAATDTSFGTGSALRLGSSATGDFLAKSFANEASFYGSVRHKSASSTTAGYGYLRLYDAAGIQVELRFGHDGSLAAYSGATLLGSVAGGAPANIWDSFQFKVVVDGVAGVVEVRKNGSATPILNLTGVNTRQGTANAYANRVMLGNNAQGNTATLFDDFFLCSGSGAAPNGWTGDMRAATQLPATDASVQLTPNLTSATFQGTASASGISNPTTNNILFHVVTATQSGPVTQASLALSNAATGKINVALYAADGVSGGPGTLLATGAEITNGVVGSNLITFPSPASVVRGIAYWLAIFSTANLNVLGSLSSPAGSSVFLSQTYALGFPNPAVVPAPTGAMRTSTLLTVSPVSHASLVADPAGQDGDVSYVSTATAGQKDLYGLAPLPTTPQAILGTVPFMVAKKSDAGTRTVAVQAKSGATEVAVVSTDAIGASYAFLGAWTPTDPATGAAWAKTAIEALQVGPKLIS